MAVISDQGFPFSVQGPGPGREMIPRFSPRVLNLLLRQVVYLLGRDFAASCRKFVLVGGGDLA